MKCYLSITNFFILFCFFPLLILSSSECTGSNNNCLLLGDNSEINLHGSSSVILAANFGPPYPSSCRGAWDGNYVNNDGLFGTGWFKIQETTTSEIEDIYCSMPPLPVSCLDAKSSSFLNTEGSTGSGTYIISPLGTFSQEVYCDMTTEEGGWTLVANIRSSGGWMVDTGTTPLSSSFSFNSEGYDPTWTSNVTYYQSFSSISYSKFLFKTGNGDYYCVLAASDVRKIQTSTSVNTQVIASSSSISSVQIKQIGQLVNIYNDNIGTQYPFVGCAGTALENQSALLWAELGLNSNQYTSFKDSHGGIGLFIR